VRSVGHVSGMLMRRAVSPSQEHRIRELLHNSENVCNDCNRTHPSWAHLHTGILLCDECATLHRMLGPPYSPCLKSLWHFESWEQETFNHFQSMRASGFPWILETNLLHIDPHAKALPTDSPYVYISYDSIFTPPTFKFLISIFIFKNSNIKLIIYVYFNLFFFILFHINFL
jgi:hypothetical protein